jgi:hypothetical protein
VENTFYNIVIEWETTKFWYGSLQRILQNFPTISQLKGKKISKNSLNRQIKEGFLELWKNQMKQYSEGKLRTYTKLVVFL